jgi:hypothetical protein
LLVLSLILRPRFQSNTSFHSIAS